MNSQITRIQSSEASFTWMIQNFHLCPQVTGEKLKSKVFSAPDTTECQWELWLYPCGNKQESKYYLSLFLNCVFKMREQVTASHQLEIQSKDGKCLGKHEETDNFDNYATFWGYSKFIQKDTLENLPDDILIVKCWVKWGSSIVTLDSDINIGISMEKGLACSKLDSLIDLSDNLNMVMNEGYHSDVTLVAKDGTKFLAHKCILSSRSLIFAAMFKHPMKENIESIIKIEDLSVHTIKSMLEFIYTSNFSIKECSFEELLFAADKYNLQVLKIKCEQKLIEQLKIDNAVNTLCLADQHNAEFLKTHTLDFVALHIKDITDHGSLKILETTDPHLFQDIIKIMAKK